MERSLCMLNHQKAKERRASYLILVLEKLQIGSILDFRFLDQGCSTGIKSPIQTKSQSTPSSKHGSSPTQSPPQTWPVAWGPTLWHSGQPGLLTDPRTQQPCCPSEPIRHSPLQECVPIAHCMAGTISAFWVSFGISAQEVPP